MECGGGEKGQGGVWRRRGGAGRGVEGQRECTGDKGGAQGVVGWGRGLFYDMCTSPSPPPPPPMQAPRSTQPVSVMDWPSTDTQSTSTGSGLAEMLALMNTASKETTYWGYKDKFLALVELEQKEHDHILTTRHV